MARLRELFDLFDRKTLFVQILDMSTRAQGAQIFIGGEKSGAPALDERSVAGRPSNRGRQVVGPWGDRSDAHGLMKRDSDCRHHG